MVIWAEQGRALLQGNGKRGAKNAFPEAELVATPQAVHPVSATLTPTA